MNTEFVKYPILRYGRCDEIEIPAPDAEVLPGVPCGSPHEFLSPAYWAYQASGEEVSWDDHHGLDAATSLWEQIVFCLLGGHGITYEVNAAAFEHLMASGVFSGRDVSEDAIEAKLREPLRVGQRSVRYRFPRVKSTYLAAAHAQMARGEQPTQGRHLRDWLLTFKGIGPKTASWIVRNHLGSDDVAILDIHVLRAGRLAGIFSSGDDVQRHYFKMEERFLQFARGLGVRASQLDIVMWQQMRRSESLVIEACERNNVAFNA